MWKSATLFLGLVVLVTWYLRKDAIVEIPKLPETYWGPGSTKADPKEIRPFKIDVPKSVIDDLNLRLDKSRDLVAPLEGAKWTYGFSSTYLKTVVDYWRNKYDWSKRQALLNKYPQFTTTIQGLDIHFYHVKPNLPKDSKLRVLPLLLVHGWPGSVVEFQKIIPLLTTPQSGKDFVFELVIPSLPGYGFSKPAAKTGLGPAQVSVVFKNLMLRLGFDKFYTQGGDWGSVVTAILAALYPENVIGSHFNMCGSMAGSNLFWLILGNYIPFLVVENEHYDKVYPLSEKFSYILEESGYMHIQSTKPDTVGAALADSPMGLAAYILEKFSTWTNKEYRLRDDGGLLEKFTMDELLDNLMLYWVTNSIATSQRLYAENFTKKNLAVNFDKIPIEVPTGCAMFPHELLYQPRSILSSRYKNLVHMTHPPRGGHFAAFEEPELLANEVWTFVQTTEKLGKSA